MPQRHARLEVSLNIYIFYFFISLDIQLTPQQQSAEPRNSAGAEALAVARRPKEASREKTFFTLRIVCTNQSSLYCLPPLALPIIVLYYCTTVAQYTTPRDHPLRMPYTIQCWQWQYRVKAKLKVGLTLRVKG